MHAAEFKRINIDAQKAGQLPGLFLFAIIHFAPDVVYRKLYFPGGLRAFKNAYIALDSLRLSVEHTRVTVDAAELPSKATTTDGRRLKIS